VEGILIKTLLTWQWLCLVCSTLSKAEIDCEWCKSTGLTSVEEDYRSGSNGVMKVDETTLWLTPSASYSSSS
jgi:hypothetical protein